MRLFAVTTRVNPNSSLRQKHILNRKTPTEAGIQYVNTTGHDGSRRLEVLQNPTKRASRTNYSSSATKTQDLADGVYEDAHSEISRVCRGLIPQGSGVL